jgi:hypothetical protein
MRNPGLLIIGVLCLLAAVIGLLSYQPASQVVYVPPTLKPAPTSFSTPISTPRPTPISTPEPPSFSVTQTGEKVWNVVLPKGQWYDTGLPMIANTRIHITGNGTYGVFLAKIGKQVLWSSHSSDLGTFVGEQGGDKESVFAGPDFLETLRLRISDDDKRDWLSLNVYFWIEPMTRDERDLLDNDPLHRALHKPAEDRAEAMLSKLRRY